MEPQHILADRYRLERHLARGGMADVWEAQDIALGRRVAVKILHPQFAADHGFVQRFRREATAAANLRHPNIVSIFDTGQDNGTYYIVMELIEGRSLRDIRRSEGPMLPKRAAEIAAETAAALEVAHEAGVYHRDVTTANIMLTADGSVRVTDFGIARALDHSEELTRTGAVIGTATYFSPEQAQGLPADERSDLYSLGIVLYELVTGGPPFTGENPVAVAYQHVSEFAVAPRVVNPDVPPELEAIIDRAMQKKPTDRYQSAEEMRADLLSFLSGDRPSTMAIPPETAAPIVAPAYGETVLMSTAPPATVPPDETARHVAYASEEMQTTNQRMMYVLALAGLLAAVALVVFFVNQLGGGATAPATVQIPVLTNMTRDEAFDVLQALDLKVRQRDESNDTIEPGRVVGSEPGVGETVDVGTSVVVIISTGQRQFPIPNVIGDDLETAIQRIEANEFVVGEVVAVNDQSAPEGIVVDQNPRSGVAGPGSVVDLEVSAGPSIIVMPNVEGLALDNALKQIQDAGFSDLEIQEVFDDEILEGFVVGTTPPADQLAPRDIRVIVMVSTGPAPVNLPSVVGDTVAAATAELEGLGLVVAIDPTPIDVTLASGLDGRIAEQSPVAGQVLEVGDTVTLVVGELRDVRVPLLLNLSEGQARDLLQATGLVFNLAGTEQVSGNLVGTVVSHSPAANESVPEGTVVDVILGVPVPTTTTTSTSTTTTTTTSTTTTTTTAAP